MKAVKKKKKNCKSYKNINELYRSSWNCLMEKRSVFANYSCKKKKFIVV